MMKALASDKTVGLGAEGLVLLAEIKTTKVMSTWLF